MTTIELMRSAAMLLIQSDGSLAIDVEFEKILEKEGWTQKTTNPSEVKSDLKEIISNIQGLENDLQGLEDNLSDMKSDLVAAIDSIEE